MTPPNSQDIILEALRLLVSFLDGLNKTDQDLLPSIIKSEHYWVGMFDNDVLAMFCINEEAEKRIKEYEKKYWHPFPGFLVKADQTGTGQPTAIKIGGACNYFSSNSFSHINAFGVEPGASFTVVDQYMEIGPEVKYSIDLAFVLGISQYEDWEGIQTRFLDLLNHSLSIWRGTK